MKLYTRGQLITVAVIVLVAALGISTLINNRKSIFSKAQELKISDVESELEKSGKNKAELETELIQNEPITIEYNSENVARQLQENDLTLDEYQNISVYEICNEAVVNINTKVTTYDWFLQPYVSDGGSGSGSIIDKRGYILTNVHVIQDATKIYVSLYDGSQYEAVIVGQDLDSDLAVLKITPSDDMELRTISFGDSDKLKVGQKVIAIGNPFGLERTMTTGIVSGLGRPIQDESTHRIIRNMVQTDAAINPGNSGGPLLNTKGQMIGINTMIVSSSGSSAGLGFAVPSKTAERVVADLLKYGKVQRGQLDAKLIQMNRTFAQYMGIRQTTGMLVSEVVKNGNAEKAGLKAGTDGYYYGSYYSARNNVIYLGGDIIVQIDDVPVASLVDYYSALESKRPGDEITVTVYRNKDYVTLTVVLTE